MKTKELTTKDIIKAKIVTFLKYKKEFKGINLLKYIRLRVPESREMFDDTIIRYFRELRQEGKVKNFVCYHPEKSLYRIDENNNTQNNR